MNKPSHVVNAVLLGVGLGYLLAPRDPFGAFQTIAAVTVPVTLGALFPDVDTAFGTHRKTFHNLATLGLFLAFPIVFGNLHLVWVGVLTHYALDFLGTKRGLALLYPLDREYDFPYGVSTDSAYAFPVTLAVTALELGVAALLLQRLPTYLPPEAVDVGARLFAV